MWPSGPVSLPVAAWTAFRMLAGSVPRSTLTGSPQCRHQELGGAAVSVLTCVPQSRTNDYGQQTAGGALRGIELR